MIKDKKGLSAIITTLLVVLLVLVAVGIVWAVVRNVIGEGAAGVELGAKCLNIDVRATAVVCTGADPNICNVTFERTGTNTDTIAGIKLVFRNSTAETSSSVIDESGNIEHLVGKKISTIETTLTGPDKVEVTVYFKDASGNEQLCSETTSFSF